MVNFSNVITLLFGIFVIINIFCGFLIIFVERRSPAATWAWLMVITLLPYAGFIIYLIAGLGSRRHWVFARKSRSDERIQSNYVDMDINGNSRFREQMELLEKETGTSEISDRVREIIYLNYHSGGGALTRNNTVEVFHEGGPKFEAFLNDIKKARQFIHLQYYIVRDDELGKKVIAALAEKAREGLDVRFLVDGMGCIWTPDRAFKPIIEAGGHWAEFLPPGYVRLNFRNHRKICVIDGQVAYIGGLNIADEYVGKVKRFGFWLDKHLRITGEAINELELRFLMDWNFSSKEKIALTDGFFPKALPVPELARKVGVQIVSSGPDTPRHNILLAYVKMISKAHKSIYIQSPYFIPDDGVLEALRIAALSGIDVRVMIPAHPDHFFVYWAALSYLGELLPDGVKCYQYEKGFVHSKMVLIDSAVASVGTANMDVRSFKLNLECNAFIYDADTTRSLEARFLSDIDDCTVIDEKWYAERSNVTKIKESVSRLLSPLL